MPHGQSLAGAQWYVASIFFSKRRDAGRSFRPRRSDIGGQFADDVVQAAGAPAVKMQKPGLMPGLSTTGLPE
jgi:hypothetical protein